jgi:hypothetical protein
VLSAHAGQGFLFGLSPTGTPTPVPVVYRGDEQRRRQPRCRVCAGIGLTAGLLPGA